MFLFSLFIWYKSCHLHVGWKGQTKVVWEPLCVALTTPVHLDTGRLIGIGCCERQTPACSTRHWKLATHPSGKKTNTNWHWHLGKTTSPQGALLAFQIFLTSSQRWLCQTLHNIPKYFLYHREHFYLTLQAMPQKQQRHFFFKGSSGNTAIWECVCFFNSFL